jgi:histone-arginine methyltransferase CARM1
MSSTRQRETTSERHDDDKTKEDQGDPEAGLRKKKSRFDDRNLDKASTEMYFHYYSLLPQQQNMLQDYVRTGQYYNAIMENAHIFKDKVVVDVGAGTGVLSLFAVQAGAKAVYAIEASDMAKHARKLCEVNKDKGGDRVHVVQCKVEDFRLPASIGKADILISEPMGTLLVNERMLESYVVARDLLLKEDGWMFPSHGQIHLAPFYDEVLHQEVTCKSNFWLQKNFYGLDLCPLHGEASASYFQQVVVDAIPPDVLLSSPVTYPIDFTKVKEADLHKIVIPLYFDAFEIPLVAHGMACWFDVVFGRRRVPTKATEQQQDQKQKETKSGSGSESGNSFDFDDSHFLTTAPGSPTTHWFQLRCLLKETLKILPGQKLEGDMKLVANSRQSYDIDLNLTAFTSSGMKVGETCSGKFDLKDPYYRQLQPHSPQVANHQ